MATNALYAALRKRGITRHLTIAIIVCVISALLLLPAIIWFHLRFHIKHAHLSMLEINGLLVYVTLCGWILPLSVTGLYSFWVMPRVPRVAPGSASPVRQKQPATALRPPRYQPGVLPPFVFGEDTAWAWLEYGSGNFQGQRLAIKRALVRIGRDEDCDIWVDDEMASRHHAEIAWNAGRVYLTDCGSMNGISLNGRRVHGTVLMHSNDLLEIGSLRFIFILAEQKDTPSALDDDPLSKHTWRSSFDLQTGGSEAVGVPGDVALADANALDINDVLPITRPGATQSGERHDPLHNRHIDGEVQASNPVHSSSLPAGTLSTFYVQDGALAGQRFIIDRPALTVGRGNECAIVMNDASISRLHIQFLHQPQGDYIQDLGSSYGTLVNDVPLHGTQQLKSGDVICLGNTHLVYTVLQTNGTTPLPPGASSPSLRSLGGPTPLRLPSRMK
ncbi:MAG: hypothetical protein NVS2B12_34240 [Ktedonobacteraceae bacterium]